MSTGDTYIGQRYLFGIWLEKHNGSQASNIAEQIRVSKCILERAISDIDLEIGPFAFLALVEVIDKDKDPQDPATIASKHDSRNFLNHTRI